MSDKRTIRKELRGQNCLFNISCLNECELTQEELLQEVVNFLPDGWQFPDIAEAAITYNGKTYQTTNFVETDWILKSEITDPSTKPLSVKVAYRKEMPASEEAPFLLEERQLIDSVSTIVQKKIAHNDLINKLQKKYALWDKAYDLADIGHWSLDVKENNLYWSSAIKKLHEVHDEYEPDLVSAINFYEEGVHRETIQNAVEKAIQTGESFDVELKIITAKDNERWIRAVGASEFKHGQCIQVFGSTQDITERKFAENKLRAQKERLEHSQQIAQVGDWEFDAVTEKITWSPMMYEIFDLDPEEGPPSYEQITSCYFNKDKQRIDEKFNRAISRGEPYDIDLQLQTGKGKKKYVRGIGIPTKNDSGQVIKVLGIVQDITKVKTMEVALKQSKQRLDAAISGADLGVWDLNLKTGKNYTNDRWWEMLGYKPDEKQYSYAFFLSLVHPEDKHKPAEVIEEIEAGHSDRVDITIRLRGKDGKYRTIQDRGKVVEYDSSGHVVRLIGTHMDISEKVELMDQVVQSAIEGEDRERRRIATELHDGIGQYLAASNMNLESVKHECTKISSKSESRFKRGLQQLKLAMAETRNTAHKLMPEVLEEYGLMLALESLIENVEKTSGINISFTSKIGDLNLRKQASINLYRIIQEGINNAIIHGKSSHISIDLRRENDKISGTIKDNGIGVNLEDPDLEKGLGMRSMQFRIQSMSGTINFDSHPKQGMRITLKIPINSNVMIEP